jgi:hypothetical protein
MMKRFGMRTGLLAVLGVSTLVGACDRRGDTDDRAALEREAFERDLRLALEPDTTRQPEFTDVADEQPVAEPPAPQRTTPAPVQRQAQPAPRPTAPRQAAPAPAPVQQQPAAPRSVSLPVPAGTTLALRMNREISTQNTRVGEAFSATLAEPVVSANGTTLIPAGATVRGQVTEVNVSARAGQTAHIKLAFNSVSFDGRTYGISATAVDVPVRTVTRDSPQRQAATVAGGAAVGAVLGQVIGRDTRSTVAGAAIGAAAGTAVAMGTSNVDAVIPQGARVVIRLDNAIQVERRV